MKRLIIIICIIFCLTNIVLSKEKRISGKNQFPAKFSNDLCELSIVDPYFISTIDSIFFTTPYIIDLRIKKPTSYYYTIELDPNEKGMYNTTDTIVRIWVHETPWRGVYGYYIYNNHTYVVEQPIKAFKQKKKKKVFYYGLKIEHGTPYLNFKYRDGKLTLVDPNIFPSD